MLSQTDFGDTTLEDWHPSYDALFIRYGKREECKLKWDDVESSYEYLDGAFVAVTPCDESGSQRRIKIGFSTVKDDGQGVITPGYFIDIQPNEEKLPVKEAIKTALLRRMDSFEDSPNDSLTTKNINLCRREQIKEGFELLQQSIELVVNSLFYLELSGIEGKMHPGRDAPPSYDVDWVKTPINKRRKITSKLNKDGFAVVYLMGQEFSGASHRIADGSKSVHWRRGHWRKQPIGPNREQIKKIWIKPMVIGAENGEPEPSNGHLYVTGKKNRDDSDVTH